MELNSNDGICLIYYYFFSNLYYNFTIFLYLQNKTILAPIERLDEMLEVLMLKRILDIGYP